MLEYRILGPLEVVGEQGPLRLGGPKQRATLAILLLSANRVVSVERLADDLYAGATPVTAVTQVQRQISELRKLLGTSAEIETRSPGYVIRISPDQLDLTRFERGTEDATQALTQGNFEVAAVLLRQALGLWRGGALADLGYDAFARGSIERLEEIRLAALEQRIEAELMLGRHAVLVAELEQLVVENPLRERLCGQLMLALYRSGRQAEALDVYRMTRAGLVQDFGIEPTPALHRLERAILAQDSALDLERVTRNPASRADRAVLVLPSGEDRLDGLLMIAEPLARLPGRELIIGRLVAKKEELASAACATNARRQTLEVSTRAAVFTTSEPALDVVRLAKTYDVELVLLDAPPGLDANALPVDLAEILEGSPADVALLTASTIELKRGAGVFVPFGGGEHDWTALELGAWLSSTTGAQLRLVGTTADLRRGRRDASRLLADASLAVQRVVGVETEPLLADPTDDALVNAVEAAALVVVGISPRWRQDGIGQARRVLVRNARPPVLLVHGGARPSGLAPRESRTRFSWTLDTRSG